MLPRFDFTSSDKWGEGCCVERDESEDGEYVLYEDYVLAWKTGATTMLNALIDRGYIGADYAHIAREGVKDLVKREEK